MTPRAYLDWNATTPLAPEARAAMIAAMDVLGNPSSVHAEGRAARALVEDARARLARALGVGADRIVFTSGATEAAALALSGRGLRGAGVEHDCVRAWCDDSLPVAADGLVCVADPARSVLQWANSETGVLQDVPAGIAFTDAAQAVGRVPFAFDWSGAAMAAISAHKFGGPKGVGALLLADGLQPKAVLRGGGQEMGRRAGTENVIGIAGMAAAAEAAVAALEAGVWDRVARLRDLLEEALEAAAPGIRYFGRGSRRLPNTTCVAVPGWKGETQVMQMDLMGFAISSGSACSSGKVRESVTLRAMGADPATAAGAIRVSLGPDTTEATVLAFADAWGRALARRRARRAA